MQYGNNVTKIQYLPEKTPDTDSTEAQFPTKGFGTDTTFPIVTFLKSYSQGIYFVLSHSQNA